MRSILSTISKLYKDSKVEFWILVVAVIISLGFLSNIPFDANGYSDETVFLYAVLVVQVLAAAAIIRYGAGKSIEKEDTDKSEDKSGGLLIAFIGLLPLIITLVTLPWLVSGVMADNEITNVHSIFFWILISYASMLLGFLVVPFVIVPLEMVGRGVLHIFRGNWTKGVPILRLGIYFAAITSFCILGAMATNTAGVGSQGQVHIIAALFGLPGEYDVTNEGLLWAVRILGLILLAITFANLKAIRKKLNPKSS